MCAWCYRCHPSAIPTITVLRKAGKWFTDCNRRLWVFRHLERHGKCETIPVILGTEISTRKMSTTNGGTEIRIRNGSPGGEWYMKPTPILNTGIGQTERNDDNQEELRSAVSPSTQETCNLKIGVKNENMNVTRGKRRKKDELPVTNRYCLRSTTLLQRQHPYNLRSHVRKPSK